MRSPSDRGNVHADEVKERFGVDMLHCPFCMSRNVGVHLSYGSHATCFSCEAEGPAVDRRHSGDPVSAVRMAAQRWNQRETPRVYERR